MSATDGPAEGESPASPDKSSEGPPPAPLAEAKKAEAGGDPEAAAIAIAAKMKANDDGPAIGIGSGEVADEGAPVIELGVDAVDLPVPEAAAPAPVALPSFMTAAEGGAPAVSDAPAIAEVEGASRIPYSPSMLFLAVVGTVTAAADIASKEWAKLALAGPDLKRSTKHLEVIRDHVDFIFAQNPGGAWSFLRSVPDGIRRPFFLFVSAAAIVFIVSVYARLEKRQWAMRWGLPLALGGAIGNLADRVRYGWVVDFVDVYYKRAGNEMHWPTFNVADVAIVAGVGLMALDLLSLRHSKAPGTAPPKVEPASGAA